METVFSHIVQKRFSHSSEDVATDALAFVLQSSEAARDGMIKLLRGIAPQLPELHFRTQQTKGSIRPDMWGYDPHGEARVFVENKFWAGLTDNQPVPYLHELAARPVPTVLLMVGPEAREESLRRELIRRLADDSMAVTSLDNTAVSVSYAFEVGADRFLALTSWPRLLAALSLAVGDDPATRSDLAQLSSLCESADHDAFLPLAPETISDQRIPALISQLSTVVQAAVDLGVSEKLLTTRGLKPQASWERIGRYVGYTSDHHIGIWFGTHFVLWKEYGITPLWVIFSTGSFSRGEQARPFLEAWAAREGVLTAMLGNDFAVGIDVARNEDKDRVVRRIVDQLRAMDIVLIDGLGAPRSG